MRIINSTRGRYSRCPYNIQSISSWGLEQASSHFLKEELDPEQNIHNYINVPGSLKIRDNLNGAVLVSGFIKFKEYNDNNIFQLLSSEPFFQFDQIVAFVDNVHYAKKILTSRTARYSGLLSKLLFCKAEYPGALPNPSQLDNIESWIANVGNDLLTLENIARLVEKSPSLKNISILITNSNNLDISSIRDILCHLQMNGKAVSIVAVGCITGDPEGSAPYQIEEIGDNKISLPPNASFSRDESLRVVASCLGLQSSINKAMVFSEIRDLSLTESKLIKGLREAGYNRVQEIDHMITKGSNAYKRAISEYKIRAPKQTTEDEWIAFKEEEFKKSSLKIEEKHKKDYLILRKKALDEIARGWAKREYYRISLKENILLSEEDYISSIWDRAIFEADLKFRMLRENINFKKSNRLDIQARKKATTLARSKAKYFDIFDSKDIN